MFQAKASQESAIPGIYPVPRAGLREHPSGFLQALKTAGFSGHFSTAPGAVKGM